MADSVGGSSPLWADTSNGEPRQLFSVPPGLNLRNVLGRVISGPIQSTSSSITSKFLGMSSTSELKVMDMVYVTGEGDIIKPEKCQTWCVQPKSRFWSKEIEQSETVTNSSDLYTTDAPCPNRTIEVQMTSPVVDNVITLAGSLGSWLSPYHGPFDIISSLVSVNASILQNNSTFLHIPGRSKYIMEWLDIVGIAPDRIVTSEGMGIWAKRLYVPRWTLHFPSSMQYHWLQAQVWSAIGIPDISSRNHLVVIKRSTRGISNHDTSVMRLALDYAASNKLQVYIHDDRDLPSVRDQLRAFAKAKIILAPHGAGEAFMIATAPGACLIEMFKPCFTPNNFSRQSTLLGLHYVAISLKVSETENSRECQKTNAPVHVEELQAAMQKCSNVMKM